LTNMELPAEETKETVVERKIMWGDLDALGIVFYPRYYEWIDGCGHLFFEAAGFRQGDLWKERGLIFGLVETSCKYFCSGQVPSGDSHRNDPGCAGRKKGAFEA